MPYLKKTETYQRFADTKLGEPAGGDQRYIGENHTRTPRETVGSRPGGRPAPRETTGRRPEGRPERPRVERPVVDFTDLLKEEVDGHF